MAKILKKKTVCSLETFDKLYNDAKEVLIFASDVVVYFPEKNSTGSFSKP